VNAAAYTSVDKAESEPARAFAVNAEAPAVIADECERSGSLLMHYSTDYVFDGSKRLPYTEEDAMNPLNVYGRSKLAGDQAISNSGARHMILRVGWVYSSHGKNFFNTVLNTAREGKPLRVVNDQVGVPTPADLIADISTHLLTSSSAINGTFHVAPYGEVSRFDLAIEILRLAGIGRADIEPVRSEDYQAPAKRPTYTVMASHKLQHHTAVELLAWNSYLKRTMQRVSF
jgi:dTDP-4-dehydrorhamnose reductase